MVLSRTQAGRRGRRAPSGHPSAPPIDRRPLRGGDGNHRQRALPSQAAAHQARGAAAFEAFFAGIPVLVALAIALLGAGSEVDARLLIYVLFGVSVILVVARVRRGLQLSALPSIVFVGAFTLWYAYPAFLDALPGNDVQLDLPVSPDPGTLIQAATCLSLFLFAGVISSSLPLPKLAVCGTWRLGEWRRRQVTVQRRLSGPRVPVLALFAVFIGLLPYLTLGGGFSQVVDAILQSRAADKSWVQSGELGNAQSALTYLSSSLMIGGACLLWGSAIDESLGSRTRALLASVALVVSAIIYLDQGTRTTFALVVLPPFVLLVLRLSRRSRPRALLACIVTLAALVVAFQFQLAYRAAYTRSDLLSWALKDLATLGGGLDFFKETAFAVWLVPSHHGFFHENPAVQFLASIIPRFLWESKPASNMIWFYTLNRWHLDIYQHAGNVLPGVVGQFYMSWGWPGPVFIGAAAGYALGWVGQHLRGAAHGQDHYATLVWIMLVVWIVLSFRLLSPGFLYPVIAAALILWIAGARQRPAPGAQPSEMRRTRRREAASP